MDGSDADDTKQSAADMTLFVQNLLQQMQSRFQTMSDSIISKIDIKNVEDFKSSTALFEKTFQWIGTIGSAYVDEMGNRIDELEQSINDLKAEMGQEGTSSPSTLKVKEEPKTADDSA